MDEKKIEAAKISHRNTIYASPRFRKGDMGDWLDGVEDDFEEGVDWAMGQLAALIDQARREGFRAGRRSKEGCVVNIDYGRNGLGAFEYLTEDDYIESLKEEEK